MAGLLGAGISSTPSLRRLIAHGEMVLAPGCYDALGARLVEEAGFQAVYMTGFGSAASLLGRPDVGLMTLSEMVDNARRIAQAVDMPVIADADTGYGNPINVIRTVHEYEAAGVAAIHLEDQVMPKKCGHMEGKQLISAGEMAAKVAAAVAARNASEFLIIARTDARAVEGLSGALERARGYRQAGADMLFVEAPQSTRRSRRSQPPSLTCHCCSTTRKAARRRRSTHAFLRELAQPGHLPDQHAAGGDRSNPIGARGDQGEGFADRPIPSMLPFEEFLDFIGIAEIRELEERFADDSN